MVSAMKVQWSSCVSVMVTMPRNRKMMQSLVAASVLSTSAHVIKIYLFFLSRCMKILEILFRYKFFLDSFSFT